MPQLPGPNAKGWLERREKAVPRAVFNILPTFIESVEPAAIIDVDGNRFIDFGAGLGVLNVGRDNPQVKAALHDQIDRYLNECFHVVMNSGYVEVAEALNRITPGDHEKKTMLANSGAEAVENAIKVARYVTGRDAIVCFTHGFSGRTLMGMTLTAKEIYRRGFGPLAPEVYRVPFPYEYRPPLETSADLSDACADYLVDTLDHELGPDKVAAVFIEPLQGEGGFIPAPARFMTRLRDICDERGILLIADEIQSGMGRTGKMFALDHFGVVPDIITTAKSLGGGLPISGITGRSELMDTPHVAGLGGTYGGNPVSCAAALAVIDQLENGDLLERGTKMAEVIRERLDPLLDEEGMVGDIRGLGPMIGVELVTDRKTKEPAALAAAAVLKKCQDEGLLILKCGTYDNVVRLMPPLTCPADDLHRGLDILTNALRSVST